MARKRFASEAIFNNGLSFPVHPFVRELLSLLNLAPTKLVPNSWRTVICCMVLWISANDDDIIRVAEFIHLYCLRSSTHSGYREFKPWDMKSRLVFDSPSSLREWKKSFFFVSSGGWEVTPNEDLDDTPRLIHQYGVVVFSASFSFLFLFTFLLISIDLLCFTRQPIHDPI